MEERMSWGGAFGVAIGNLTGVNNEGSSVRTIRWVFFLIFIGGIAWAGYNYFEALDLLEEKDYPPRSSSAAALKQDETRLANLVNQVKTTTEARSSSPQMALAMQEVGKYPFADPSTQQVLPASRPGDLIVVDIPEVIIDYPPEGVTLRAIMIMGKQHVAVMDIPGVGSGMVVKVGDTFMQKKGRIVRILPDKVVLRWGGKNWDIAPGF